jgi:PHS family inorganic phosphate transporter-like MFS transporter
MVSVGTILGGLLMIKVVKYVSPKTIQFWGFLVLFVLFIVTGSAWRVLLGATNRSGLIILYVFSQVAFNLGPNVTTFIIPAEIFPTRYRCTCHGIAAASGKLGSWVVQIFLQYSFPSGKDDKDDFQWERDNFGHVLQVMSAFMVAGAVTTYFLVPETRDHDNKSRTLEVLACGKKVIDELNIQRKREDEDE